MKKTIEAQKLEFIAWLMDKEPYINQELLEKKLNDHGLKSVRQKISELLEEMTQTNEQEYDGRMPL